MQASSKVRIEFTEYCNSKSYNFVAKESGTVGQIDLGTDLCYALDECPRPLQVLVEALVEYGNRFSPGGLAGRLVAAAKGILTEYQKYDKIALDGTPTDEKKVERLTDLHCLIHGEPKGDSS